MHTWGEERLRCCKQIQIITYFIALTKPNGTHVPIVNRNKEYWSLLFYLVNQKYAVQMCFHPHRSLFVLVLLVLVLFCSSCSCSCSCSFFVLLVLLVLVLLVLALALDLDLVLVIVLDLLILVLFLFFFFLFLFLFFFVCIINPDWCGMAEINHCILGNGALKSGQLDTWGLPVESSFMYSVT